MAVKMDDFLLEYYRRLIFSRIPTEQYATLCEHIGKNDLTKGQKEWTDLLVKNAAGEYQKDAAGFYVRKGVPDPTERGGEFELENNQWEKLYAAFHATLQTMASDTDLLKYNKKAQKFVNDYFGPNKLFSPIKASAQAETEISKIINILTTDRLKARNALGSIVQTNEDYDKLIADLRGKKYNNDPKAKQQLLNVAYYLAVAQDHSGDRIFPDIDNTIIENGFVLDPNQPNTYNGGTQLDTFKSQYTSLLNTLYTEDELFKAFQSRDQSSISKKLTEAKDHLNYNDNTKEEYLPPKRSDELTPAQRMSEWCSNTYEDYIEKYIKFSGDRLYFSPQAREIVRQIGKAKIKPTDGLEKIVAEKDKILANFPKGHAAYKHCDWLMKTLTEFSQDKNMSKTFAGALQNGQQMRKLVTELIIKAIKEGKKDEAKTAMEVLSVIKYGATTSKVMDTLRKEEFSLFSDKNLSWNKNEAISFITKALDKSIKFAFLGIGYGLTMAGNAIRLSGSKFNGKMDKNLADAKAQHDTISADKKQQDLANLHVQEQNANHVIHDSQATINDLANVQRHGNYAVHAANLNTQKQQLETLQQDERNKSNVLGTAESALQQADAAQQQNAQVLEPLTQAEQNLQDIQTKRTQLQTQLTQLNQQLQQAQSQTPVDPNLVTALQQAYNDKFREEFDLGAQETQLNTNIQNLRNAPQISQALADKQRLEQAYQQAEQVFNNAQQDYNNAQQETSKLRTNIDQFEAATAKIAAQRQYQAEVQQQINKLNTNDQTDVRDLMAYWDMLETGRDSHRPMSLGGMYSWFGSKKKSQAAFDLRAPTMIDQFKNSYQLR